MGEERHFSAVKTPIKSKAFEQPLLKAKIKPMLFRHLPKLFLSICLLQFANSKFVSAEDISSLIEAAKNEPPLTVYDNTGRIKAIAAAFTKKYGVRATGVKISSDDQIELIVREARAGSVRADVIVLSDVASAQQELFSRDLVVTYVPPQHAPFIAPQDQDPLIILRTAAAFSYNKLINPDGCPFDNIWALTEPEFSGRLVMRDPLYKPSLTDWFNQLEAHADEAVAAAYKARYGTELSTKEKSATATWAEALARNRPLLGRNDGTVADTVGAPGVASNYVGIFSVSKFRSNKNKGYNLAICNGVDPFVGYLAPKILALTKNSDSPNAAKLMVHYLLTEEGIALQIKDGKISSNSQIKMPDSEPSGIGNVLDQLYPFKATTAIEDWKKRRDWQDLWRLSYRR